MWLLWKVRDFKNTKSQHFNLPCSSTRKPFPYMRLYPYSPKYREWCSMYDFDKKRYYG